GVEGVDQERNRFGDPDRVGHLDFTLRRESGGNDILRDMARHIASRTVDLARVFTRKRAAAVTAVAAVAVDDNLAPGETAVAVRPADDETAGWVDVKDRRFVEVLRRNRFLDQLLDDGFANRCVADGRTVLGRNDHRRNTYRIAVHMADRDLALAVGTQEVELFLAAQLREVLHQLVRQ